ncbi:glycosyltransferase family 2 protein [Modicisalibacter zincidurans]|uniref:Glycosyltransferase 2-like domain-containing protein n=1 Tax=Modicisalibacter zincidurans TaxID=1178777 RepID=A0ABP9RBX9_9GAMM|nr:glycosyltransferase family A protein [Halomonas zincidurans]
MNSQPEACPRVSIVIPSYNRWPHVCEAIDSVIKQDYENIECIVVDDASTDGSFKKIAQHYSSEEKVSVRELSKNAGQSAARNFGARLATGELLCFLDSDDLLLEGSIKYRASAYIETQNYKEIVVGGNITSENKTLTLPSPKERLDAISLNEYLSDRGWIHTNTIMMPTQEFLKLKGFKENLRQKEDIEFFIRALCHMKTRYCGYATSQMRSVDHHRARHDYEHIAKQGYGFLNAIKSNQLLKERVSPKILSDFLKLNLNSYLNALYKLKRYSEFRSELVKARKNGDIKITKKIAKRYMVSLVK